MPTPPLSIYYIGGLNGKGPGEHDAFHITASYCAEKLFGIYDLETRDKDTTYTLDFKLINIITTHIHTTLLSDRTAPLYYSILITHTHTVNFQILYIFIHDSVTVNVSSYSQINISFITSNVNC